MKAVSCCRERKVDPNNRKLPKSPTSSGAARAGLPRPPSPPPPPPPPPRRETQRSRPARPRPLANLRRRRHRLPRAAAKCIPEGEATGPERSKSSPFANLRVHACEPLSCQGTKEEGKKKPRGLYPLIKHNPAPPAGQPGDSWHH